jgi:hypothetical protein
MGTIKWARVPATTWRSDYDDPRRSAKSCRSCIGLIASGGVYVAHMGGPLSKLMAAGGFNLSSLTNSIWETTIVAGLSVGLIVAFRELLRGRYRLLNTMAAASFATSRIRRS